MVGHVQVWSCAGRVETFKKMNIKFGCVLVVCTVTGRILARDSINCRIIGCMLKFSKMKDTKLDYVYDWP